MGSVVPLGAPHSQSTRARLPFHLGCVVSGKGRWGQCTDDCDVWSGWISKDKVMTIQKRNVDRTHPYARSRRNHRFSNTGASDLRQHARHMNRFSATSSTVEYAHRSP